MLQAWLLVLQPSTKLLVSVEGEGLIYCVTAYKASGGGNEA